MTLPPAKPEAAETKQERTFAFVDLAGFTALTEIHGDVEAADLAERFTTLSRSVLQPDDQLVKSMGDAVMLAFPGPDSALGALARLIDACNQEPGFPSPRAGLHHGSAVERGGDWFGRSVNLTARVTDQARGGQSLATSDVADAARALELPTVALGCFEFHNLADAVELWDIAVAESPCCWFVDPVCRMRIERNEAAGRLRYAEKDWWFCSLECASAFAQYPKRYAAK
ncbi:MAG: YHS domain-containing protein [Acidimicrobiia bacterium]